MGGAPLNLRGMMKRPICATFLVLGLTACGPEPDDGSGVRVEVDMAPHLKSAIHVASKRVQSPGRHNPIEVAVTVNNAGASDHQILFCPCHLAEQHRVHIKFFTYLLWT